MKTVAIAGASGFVGSHLKRKLGDRFRVIGLSRGKPKDETWRSCDLFSLLDAEQALEGVEIAYYLVHSMMPSARLTQGAFEDLDLIVADNFARAAAKTGVKQIIYVGGLVPPDGDLSPHLRSRLEVEKTLGSHGVPVTALRAGIVVGVEGSSFQILYRLVTRLAVMVCPAWTETPTHPIALNDIVDLLAYCADRPETFGQEFDVGGPDVVTYRRMIEMMAKALGRRRFFLRVPYVSPILSRLWITLVTGAPRALVAPLVESLLHRMVARDRRLQAAARLDGTPLAEALGEAVKAQAAKTPKAFSGRVGAERVVRSVQRMPLPSGRDAQWVAEEYLRWLPRALPFVRVHATKDRAEFSIVGIGKPLLVLDYSRERSFGSRALFYVKGGLLARVQGRGRLEFREVLDGKTVIAALHDFYPRLPWFLYAYTQAKIHLWVMRRFGRYLSSSS